MAGKHAQLRIPDETIALLETIGEGDIAKGLERVSAYLRVYGDWLWEDIRNGSAYEGGRGCHPARRFPESAVKPIRDWVQDRRKALSRGLAPIIVVVCDLIRHEGLKPDDLADIEKRDQAGEVYRPDLDELRRLERAILDPDQRSSARSKSNLS